MLALGLVTLAVLETERLGSERQLAVFEREAAAVTAEVKERLASAKHALQALHSAALIRGGLDRDGLREAARWWLSDAKQIQAMGYSQRVAVGKLAAFEAEVRAQGQPDYHVFDRDDGSARARDGEIVAIRYIEPVDGNAVALGVNALSIPAARAAIQATRDSGRPAASAVFQLTQSSQPEAGLVIYQALYKGAASTVEEREALFSGVVFVTLRTETAMAGLSALHSKHLRWCLFDTDLKAKARRLAGPVQCEGEKASKELLTQQTDLPWAGRTLSLRVVAPKAKVEGHARQVTWMLALTGMAAASMLGALLLTVTGHTRRTEIAVRSGTAELRNQVAEREQAESALRESSDRLRSILDHVPLGVIFMDPEGRLIECNPRFCAMTGRSLSDLLGRSVAELVHPEGAAVLRRMRRDLLAGADRSVGDELRLRGRDGRAIVMRVSVSALRSPSGEILRMVGVVEDITDHLRLRVSERALHRAEAANRAKSEFLSRISHELRTPLNAMLGFAQLLSLDAEPGLAGHQREWAQQIQRAGWHLLDMINETLDLARIESGAVQLVPVPVALDPLIAACSALLATPAVQRQVSITTTLGANAGAVLADPTRLKQVLTNLLSNAVKYNREGGQVTLSTRRVSQDGSDMIEIAVADTGMGLTPEQLAALFQPYNRLGRERSDIEGTGIGLVISRGLAELMGGSLLAASEPDKGSVFTLSLPAAESAEAPLERHTDTTTAPYHRRLVHYVEDNETNVEVMRGVFAQRPQIELEVSTLGLDGMVAIKARRPDLILLDMQLPDISGLELLRHMKLDDAMADIPVVVVSADATPQQTQAALTSGALHYVTKPLDVARFLAVVDQILEQVDTHWG